MSVNSAQISVGNATPVALFVQGSGAGQFTNVTGDVTEGFPTIIANTHATITVFLGPAGVTSATGFPLLAQQSIPITWLGTDATTLFAIAASGTVTVAILSARQS